MFAGTLAELGPTELAARLYEQLSLVAAQSNSDQLRKLVPRFEGAVRRLGLVGQPIELEGETLSGERLDWDAYRGKVVLVEFWATWCIPELNEVLEHYKRYHDRGFEVIGVTFDRRQSDAEKFVADRGIPWVNLFSSKPSERGPNHPVARRYGISAIPAGILVDRDGTVISVNAKDEELDSKLESLFGPAPTPSSGGAAGPENSSKETERP